MVGLLVVLLWLDREMVTESSEVRVEAYEIFGSNMRTVENGTKI
jgi:hypothetical protein